MKKAKKTRINIYVDLDLVKKIKAKLKKDKNSDLNMSKICRNGMFFYLADTKIES